jgi:hypothetical protein
MLNREVLEMLDIVPAFVPVDMQSGANNGQWVNMRYLHKLLAVLYKAGGTAGDDPVFTLKQATSNSGTGAKALNFTRYRTKVGAALASLTVQTVTTQSAGNTCTPTSAANPGIIAVEVNPTDLDLANGFNFVQLSIPDTGSNAQLGCAFYLAIHKYDQNIPPNVLS